MKRSILYSIIAVVALLCGLVTYCYLSPDITIAVGVGDPSAESYVRQVMVGCSTKLGLPIPQRTKDRINEFTQTNEAFVLGLIKDYSKPMKVDAVVEVADGQTIVTYTGTATDKAGGTAQINESLAFDFVLTDRML